MKKLTDWIPVDEQPELLNSLDSGKIEVLFKDDLVMAYNDTWPLEEVTHWRVAPHNGNPHPRQITTTDNFGNVTGCYDNQAWAEWERENKINTK